MVFMADLIRSIELPLTCDFLKVGDEIRIEIDGLGTMINPVVAR